MRVCVLHFLEWGYHTPTFQAHGRGILAIFGRLSRRTVSKLADPSYHSNRGRSGTNATSTVKYADPDNSLLGAGMGVVSPIQAELLPMLCSNNGG